MSKPSQDLWRLLLTVSSADELKTNLNGDEDFQRMRGPLEARFVEWTYHLRERRLLVERLRSHLLRASDTTAVARRAGVPKRELKHLDSHNLLHSVLGLLGIPEPRPAPPLADGVQELRLLQESLGPYLSGEEVEPPVATARRGAERLLKIIIRFLWGSKQSDILLDIARHGLHEFHARDVDDEGVWLGDLDLGTSCYLLRAFEAEKERRQRALPFVLTPEVWSSKAHERFLALANALSKEVHDSTLTVKQRRDKQHKSVTLVCQLIDAGELAIPRSVCFFRRYQDGPAFHLEGYATSRSGEPERLQFYEVEQPVELQRDYMFLAATNPSAVNASIVDLVPAFMEPV